MLRDNVVEQIQKKDLKQLWKINRDVLNNKAEYEEFEKNYKELEQNKNVYALGYYIEDNLVGAVMLNIIILPSGKEATIWDLNVKEEYRRRGIASKLMNRAEEIAKTYDNISRIWLFSGFHRVGAHELYRKRGYDEDRDKAFVKIIKK